MINLKNTRLRCVFLTVFDTSPGMDLCECRHPTRAELPRAWSTQHAQLFSYSSRRGVSYTTMIHVRTMPHGHPCPWETFATGALVWPPCLSPKSIDPSSVDSCINAFGSSGGSFCSCSSFNLWPSAPWCAWCASVSCRSFCWRFGKKLGLAACETKSKLSQSTIKRGPR